MDINAYLDIFSQSSLWLIFFVSSIICFALMGVDKMLAIAEKRRIPEKVLMGFAMAFGSFGGLIGMYTFRHKTKKEKFKYGLPALLVVQVVILVII